MAELYFTTNLDNERTLFIAPLTNRRIAMSGQSIDDPNGYFLYEVCRSQEPHETKIIAKILSEEHAVELSQMLKMS